MIAHVLYSFLKMLALNWLTNRGCFHTTIGASSICFLFLPNVSSFLFTVCCCLQTLFYCLPQKAMWLSLFPESNRSLISLLVACKKAFSSDQMHVSASPPPSPSSSPTLSLCFYSVTPHSICTHHYPTTCSLIPSSPHSSSHCLLMPRAVHIQQHCSEMCGVWSSAAVKWSYSHDSIT